MYGTIFHMMALDGKEDELKAVFDAWESERKPNVQGVVAGYLMKTDNKPNEFIGIAVFESKELYLANGNDPAQGEWFGKVRALLQSDPVWEDGEYIDMG